MIFSYGICYRERNSIEKSEILCTPRVGCFWKHDCVLFRTMWVPEGWLDMSVIVTPRSYDILLWFFDIEKSEILCIPWVGCFWKHDCVLFRSMWVTEGWLDMSVIVTPRSYDIFLWFFDIEKNEILCIPWVGCFWKHDCVLWRSMWVPEGWLDMLVILRPRSYDIFL